MIRLVCSELDCFAVNVGGNGHTQMKTFDVELPEVEAWLSDKSGMYIQRAFVGVEILPRKTENAQHS